MASSEYLGVVNGELSADGGCGGGGGGRERTDGVSGGEGGGERGRRCFTRRVIPGVHEGPNTLLQLIWGEGGGAGVGGRMHSERNRTSRHADAAPGNVATPQRDGAQFSAYYNLTNAY